MITRIKYLFAKTKNTYPYVVSAKRTPIGKFMGNFAQFSATELGALSIRGAALAINLNIQKVNEVIMGCAITAGLGQAPARQASIKAGLQIATPCTTISSGCTSSLQAIILASRSIQIGQNDIVVSGGFESSSNVPFYILNHRKGFSYGQQKLSDGIIVDSLLGFQTSIPLGIIVENTAVNQQISRSIQDGYAILSYQRALQAHRKNYFGQQLLFSRAQQEDTHKLEDEYLNGFRKQMIRQLRPIYNPQGTITVGNSSQIGDGACSLILASSKSLGQNKFTPLAKIVGYQSAAVKPNDFCYANSQSIKKLLQSTGMQVEQIDLIQLGQLFSVSSLITLKTLKIPIQKLNINGGNIAFGSSFGMMGSRLVTSLITSLNITGKRYGIAAVTNGFGQSSAILIQNMRL